MNIYKYVTRVAFLLIAMMMSVTTITAQSDGNGYGGFDPSNPGNPGSNGWNAATGEVIIDDFTTGSLNSAIKTVIGSSGASAVTQIVVSGSINRSDFTVANSYSNCTLIDFSRTAGLEYVPSSAYSGNAALCSILLPTSITSIQSSAFKNCTSLTSLTSYTLTPPTVTSNAFDGVNESLVVYVPADAVDAYMNAEVWKNFTILPIQSSVHSVTIGMPEGTDMSIYKNMNLQLVNAKSGQKYKYILTDKMSYRFGNLVENTVYNAYVLNEKDSIFGKIENITLNTEDVTATFTTLAKPQQVSLSIVTPEGKDVTSETTVTWTDANGNYIGQAYSIAGHKVGTQLKYRVVLPEALAVKYASLNATDYTVADGNNSIICKLDTIQKIKVSGNVKDATTNLAISSAVVTASQTFGGKYTRTVSAKTDTKGNYTLEISSVPTSLAVAATDYITKSIPSDSLNIGTTDFTVPDVKLKSISGAVINLGFTYTESKAEGEEAEVQNWYDDYNNVDYSIYDKTSRKNISQFSAQYPKIVLLEDVAEGDVLELTASSRKSAFTPVTTSVTINAEQNVDVTFNVVELGGIKSSFVNNANATVVGILYNADGKMLKNSQYSDGTVEFSDLADGNYTLVTMGSSTLFNNVYDLSQFEAAGLTAGTDYVQKNVAVKSGEIISLSIAEVPVFNDSKLHYTGDNTSFTVNKSSIVAGNYLTLTGHIDFKSEYASEVSDVNLVVDLPESCSFVENSVMVGSSTGSYSLDGSRITIPMANYSERVRFCIIPTESGDYAPSALVQFSVGGNTISQPIGSANYTAKNLSISVPSTVAHSSFNVSGTAMGNSSVEVYDGTNLIGQTTTLANGNWSALCKLGTPFNYSSHQIYANVTNNQGVIIQTESQDLYYDKNAIEVKTVTMLNTAHTAANLNLYEYKTVFDFQNPDNDTKEAYWYWPSYPTFTFLVDFTDNDTTKIKNVDLFVYTSDDKVVHLYPKYDGKRKTFIATHDFTSSSKPETVSVNMVCRTDSVYDNSEVQNYLTELFAQKESSYFTTLLDKANKCLKDYGFIEESIIDEIRSNIEVDKNYLSKEDSTAIANALGTDKMSRILNEIAYEKSSSPLHSGNDNFYKLLCNTIVNPEIYNQVNIDPLTLINSNREIKASNNLTIYNESKKDITLVDLSKFSLVDIVDYTSEDGNRKKLYYSDINSQNRELLIILDVLMPTNDLKVKGINTLKSSNISDAVYDNVYDIFGYYVDITASSFKYITESTLDVALTLEKAGYIDDAAKWLDVAIDAEKEANKLSNLSTGLSIVGAAMSVDNIYKERKNMLKDYDNWDEIKGFISENCSISAKDYYYELADRFQDGNWDREKDKSLKDAQNTMASALSSLLPGGLSLLGGGLSLASSIKTSYIGDLNKEENEANIAYIKTAVSGDKRCKPFPEYDYGHMYPGERKKGADDPSGYVYEAISSNRLEGVTATCYYKETTEDMYGDLHENTILWDASQYQQENPLYTDADGQYAWMVPQGLWQVKFEKEGYETTYSDWLPVPPPQLDINIPMTQNTQPEVKTARAFDDAVTVEFDKYMLPDLLTTDNITVKADGKTVEGTIALLNEEVKCEGATEKYASKVRFNAANPFTASEVTLTVSRNVKSYAGITMENDFSQTFTVEHEVQKIECDSTVAVNYGGTKVVTVSVLPVSASAGKTLRVKNSSSMILSASATDVLLDAEGKAAITVSGELPGTAALTYTVDGYDISASQIVNVEDKANETVAAPVASIASGSAVAKGTEVTLTTTEKDAKIYYTLDGSCPCENASRILYEKPIAINKDITIKAMTIASDDTESEVATFVYYIDTETSVEYVTTNENGVTTYVTKHNLDFSDMGVLSAYVATELKENSVKLAKATIVPTGEGIVLVGAPNTTYKVLWTVGNKPEGYKNIFKASDGTYTVADGDYTYALNTSGEFCKVSAGVTIPDGKAYLQSNNPILAKTLIMDFGDDATGINSLNSSSSLKGIIYNLNGQKLRVPQKGINIINCKKVLVK